MRGFLSTIRKAEAFALIMLAIVAVFLLGGCGSTGTESEGIVTSTRHYESLQISLTTHSAARLGDVVPITYTLTNIGAEAVYLIYGDPAADAQVTQGPTEIWRWSFGQAFPAILFGQLLAPGESNTYSWNWEQKDNEGRQIPLGSYTINAWFDAESVNRVKVTPQIDLAAKPITIVLHQ